MLAITTPSSSISTCDRGGDAMKTVKNVIEWLLSTGNRSYLREFDIPASKECLNSLARWWPSSRTMPIYGQALGLLGGWRVVVGG